MASERKSASKAPRLRLAAGRRGGVGGEAPPGTHLLERDTGKLRCRQIAPASASGSRFSAAIHFFENGVYTVNGSPAPVAMASGSTRSASGKSRNRAPARSTAACRLAVAPLGVRPDLVIGVDGLGVRLLQQRRQGLGGRAGPQEQAAADRRERPFELRQALAQEPEARGADVGIVRVVVIQDEDRHHAVRVASGGGEGGVVGNAQVAAEPVDDRRHGFIFATFQFRNPAKATQAA